MIRVFYDGKCGLCSKEINYYRKIAAPHHFEWIDITEDVTLFNALGYTQEQGLKILHVQDDQQQMQTGVKSFVTIWQALPKWRFLAMIVNLPIVLQCIEFVYRRFAAWRFKRLGYQCRL